MSKIQSTAQPILCPFCGNQDSTIESRMRTAAKGLESEGQEHYVFCHCCEAQGPPSPIREHARMLWEIALRDRPVMHHPIPVVNPGWPPIPPVTCGTNRPEDGRTCDCEDAPCCGHYDL